MAATRLVLLGVVLFFLIVQVSSDAEVEEIVTQNNQAVKAAGASRKLIPLMDCGGLCRERCSLHSRPNLCKRACGTCCMRCKCVPPGTSGNREICGSCYTDMTTHGNRTKCP